MFSPIAWSTTTPCSLRSSGTMTMPSAMASAGLVRREFAAVEPDASPRVTGSAPAIARTSSVRPAPTRPATPRISPSATEKDDVREGAVGAGQPLAPPARFATSAAGTGGNMRSRLRPTMLSTTVWTGVALSAKSATSSPSRRTTIRSVMLADLLQAVADVDDPNAFGPQLRTCSKGARSRRRRAPRSARRG